MENNRGQSIFLSVVGIATLLVAIVGATFAYFSITVNGNENASSIYVTTAKLGDVTFDGTSAGIVIENAYPGWHDQKTFTIATANDTDANATIQYGVQFVVTNGELATAAPTGEFVYTLTPSGSCGTLPTALTNQDVPSSTPANPVVNGTLQGPCTHTYTLRMDFVETNEPQNLLQGKKFEGKIQIVVANEQGMRTWDDQNSTWKQWSSQNNG